MSTWIRDALNKAFGEKIALSLSLIAIGIVVAFTAPRIFVTFAALADQIRPLRQCDILQEQKLVEFQKGQVQQMKWELEDRIDAQGTGPTQRQQGRLQEIKSEIQTLETRKKELEKEMKECK